MRVVLKISYMEKTLDFEKRTLQSQFYDFKKNCLHRLSSPLTLVISEVNFEKHLF